MKDNSKVYKIFSLKSRKAIESDRIFWSSKTPEERLAAMEVLRKQWYKIKNERPIPMNRDEELFILLI